jgi:5'-phosphate synthase pdxT subunit
MKIGVLALQGDFREHIASLQAAGAEALPIRRASELFVVDGLVLPGGESTTISQLARELNLFDAIKKSIAEGLPTYGSCAGMILLADNLVGGVAGQETFGGLDITVRRNAFGRQVDSFEARIDFAGRLVNGVFIRAPWVESVGVGVEVLATYDNHVVAVRQRNVLATSFHPELTSDVSVHAYFLEEFCSAR